MIKQKELSPDEYSQMINFMASNRKDHKPKVGIFWYDADKDELFGVVRSDPSKLKVNCGDGRISCSELHEDIWKKGVYDRKYHKTTEPFIGQYQDTPRGRIFYNPKLDSYDICVGNWIKKYPNVIDLVMMEFNLPEDSTEYTIQHHWDIGQTWS